MRNISRPDWGKNLKAIADQPAKRDYLLAVIEYMNDKGRLYQDLPHFKQLLVHEAGIPPELNQRGAVSKVLKSLEREFLIDPLIGAVPGHYQDREKQIGYVVSPTGLTILNKIIVPETPTPVITHLSELEQLLVNAPPKVLALAEVLDTLAHNRHQVTDLQTRVEQFKNEINRLNTEYQKMAAPLTTDELFKAIKKLSEQNQV